MILYVKFNSPVNLGGDAGDVQFWKHDREGKHTKVVEGSDYLDIHTQDGNVRRVPWSNVAYVHMEKPAAAKAELPKGGKL